MDRRAWWATVYGVAKSQTHGSDLAHAMQSLPFKWKGKKYIKKETRLSPPAKHQKLLKCPTVTGWLINALSIDVRKTFKEIF